MTETYRAEVLGTIEGATNPESAELLSDGETIVWGNCAMVVGLPEYRAGRGLVYLRGQAFISKGRIAPSGEVTLTERHLIEGLTATLGCDVLRVATGRFPEGSVFIEEGGRPITTDGKTLDSGAKPRVMIFDPDEGEVLGEVPLDGDSVIGRAFNALDQPNGIALDSQRLSPGLLK